MVTPETAGIQQVSLTREHFASLVSALLQMDPDDWCPTRPKWPFPPGPRGDDGWSDKIGSVFLNPQPLPPLELGALIAGSMLSHFQDLEARGDSERVVKDVHELVEWCGSVPRGELLRLILKKMKPRGWPMGPLPEPWREEVFGPVPDPWRAAQLTGPSLIVIGSVLVTEAKQFQRGLAENVAQAGTKMLALGLERTGLHEGGTRR